ncbi:uncharacterized protein C3orf86 homolog isoform X2 [Tupaia chinensis]|nr:uncharacterized protein C3orf86 homolog isoform X2 [Tupaia chinensis]
MSFRSGDQHFLKEYEMSRSQPGRGRKPVDVFFWVNEVTGEITYPMLKADVPASSEHLNRELPRLQGGTAWGALSPHGALGLVAAPTQRLAPPKPPATNTGSRSSLALAQTPGQERAGARGSLPPCWVIPVTMSPPAGTLGPTPPLPACVFPPSPPTPWDLTCKLKNVLAGSNRFSF